MHKHLGNSVLQINYGAMAFHYVAWHKCDVKLSWLALLNSRASKAKLGKFKASIKEVKVKIAFAAAISLTFIVPEVTPRK